MQIICISRGSLGGGKKLAERLAEKLGYRVLSREDLLEAAVADRIHVGKLETAMMKPGRFSERLAIEREHYLAFTTAYLCDRAREGRLVYHGRTGHLLLPGVSHLLRVRVVADMEYRIKAAMQQLAVDRVKARRYVEEVDEDRKRWVRHMYGVSWEDAGQYDIIVNLEQMVVENAAAALTAIAQLPDFQMTPMSKRTMEDLRLASHARLRLARDSRTSNASFKVRSDSGVVTVTYNPRDARLAAAILSVLEDLEEISEVRATMATSSILWIQEDFKPQSETFKQVTEIAQKWNAAVELVRFDAKAEDAIMQKASAVEGETAPALAAAELSANGKAREYEGGIEDDVEEGECDDEGMRGALDELARLGRSGGGQAVCGSHDRLLNSLDRKVPYALIVIGDLFLTKGDAARNRLTRELRSFLSDRVHSPVVTADELKSQYLFGKRDLFRLFAYLGITALIYLLVFSQQVRVLHLLSGEGWKAKALASLAVFVLVPLVAYLYGNAAKAIFKLVKME